MKRWVAVLLALLTVGVSAQTPCSGTACTRIGPQTVYIFPVSSVTHGEFFTTADLQSTFTDGRFASFWSESSDGQYGPFNTTIVPTQLLDDTAQPLNYNDCIAATNTLSAYASQRIDAMFGTSTQIRFFTWFFIMQPRFGCGNAGGGGSVRPVLRGYAGQSQVLHEHGHGLGTQGEGKGQVCSSSGCGDYEYADTYSIMGDGWNFPRQISTIRKIAAGWLNGVGQSRVQDVTQSGDYALPPFERGAKGRTVALRTGSVIYLEARVDGDSRGGNAGIIMRQGDVLMDLDRTDSGAVDRVLDVAQTFTLNGISYTTLTFGPSGAVVRITVPGTAPALPVTNLRAS